MLDVRRLRVLREVAAQGSFSAAAQRLAYTQSAVSQQIAALEREAGARLVERGARGVRLTDAGRALVEHADVILARLADAEAELEALSGLRGGRLRLVSLPSVGATVMPPAIARFRERHPGVELTLALAEPRAAESGLRAGNYDVALTIQPPAAMCPPADDGLDRLHLLDDPMHLLLPATHPLADVTRPRLADLADDPWLVGEPGAEQCPDVALLLRTCRSAGFEPRIALHSDDYLAIQGFVAAGVGVSLIPDLALVSVRDDVVVRSLEPDPPVRRVQAATLRGGWRSPAATAMLDLLVEVGDEFQRSRRTLALAA